MEMLSKNYLQEAENLNRSFHGARRKKLKFRMTKESTLEKSRYQREAKYIEMKPTIWAGFLSKTSPVHKLPRSQGAQADQSLKGSSQWEEKHWSWRLTTTEESTKHSKLSNGTPDRWYHVYGHLLVTVRTS